MIDDDEDGGEDYEESDQEAERILRFGHQLDERYVGDHRFEIVELDEPGPLDGEDFRLRFNVDEQTHFLVSVFANEGFVRVGLATADETVSTSIEEAILESGESPTEFLARAMDAEDELEHEVQHFHDDVFYFASEIPFDLPQELLTKHFREQTIAYLEGYIDAFLEMIEAE